MDLRTELRVRAVSISASQRAMRMLMSAMPRLSM